MADFTVTRTIDSFEVGDRVAVHPASTLWMRGVRYGVVARVGRKYVFVQTDMREAPFAFYPRDLAVEA